MWWVLLLHTWLQTLRQARYPGLSARPLRLPLLLQLLAHHLYTTASNQTLTNPCRQVLLRDRFVFRCHSSRWHTIYHSELGSSASILAAGYNLDCFMTRYQGVNWRDRRNWGCNGRASPQVGCGNV